MNEQDAYFERMDRTLDELVQCHTPRLLYLLFVAVRYLVELALTELKLRILRVV